jgi:hypothetical protein
MKKDLVLIFNAKTGVFIGTVENASNFDPLTLSDKVKYKEISLAEDEYWFGDFDNGRVYKVTEKAFITQMSLRDKAISTIIQKYNIFSQLSIIRNQLKQISGENLTEKFSEMETFISETLNLYQLEKEAYASNPDAYIWDSDETFFNDYTSRLEGMVEILPNKIAKISPLN